MQLLKIWLPAISGMACLGLGAGLIGIFGFFVGPLSEEFGVGVAVLNMAPVALLLVPGIVAPLIGTLADKLPIRGLMLTGVTLAMLSLVGISQAPTLWLAGLCFVIFSLGLTFYGPVVVNGLMIKLYEGREARALAIAAIGMSLATAILPPTIGLMLESLSWRAALLSLALVLLVLLWLLVLAGIPRGVIGTAAVPDEKVGKPLYRGLPFWLIGFCVALAFNVSVVLAICYPPLFASQGYSLTDAGGFLALAGLAGLVGKSSMAWMGDAGSSYAKWLAALLLLLQVAAMCLLLTAVDTPQVLIAMCLAGFGGGAFIPMHPYLNSRYFDAGVIGQVNGAQMPLFLPFGLVGAPLAGYSFDQAGNYDTVLIVLAVTLVLAAVLALLLPASTRN